ncbi:NAD(P)/FAD-dependent oxidoreductase [Halorarius halobius]|uniref:NAD(P)/FAD-dependent oxidoreductase n=1 Tax=Halorarius halobius TaxID=2962671 RepID=UPI0020CB9299|nr:NAD(P)/FAD-dependent oxidoreductase [Halorarius halobius]
MTDRDAVVVGGGPAGTTAGVFLARYGLDTVLFDRGAGALPRAAFLENYPGFPAGIDPETLQALLRDHLDEVGCDRIEETVERIDRVDGRFRVETTDRTTTADYVVAAAWYDGSYLRPTTGEAAFHEHVHHGEREERFDPDYPDADGRTPVEGLYAAAPSGDRNDQAIVAAGHGAHVARCLVEDHRRAEGFPEGVAAHYDWLRPDSEFTGEWADRDRWREWFANEAGDHDLSDERFAELRERYIDRAFGTARSDDDVERLRRRGHRRVAEHLDDAAILEAVDDAAIRAYLDEPTDR